MPAVASLVPLLVVPIALGAGLLGVGAGVGTCWWLGTAVAALAVVIGHAIRIPQPVVLVAISVATAISLVARVRRGSWRTTPSRRDVVQAALLALLISPLVAAGVLRTLDHPALGADAIVIWYAKAKALYQWLPFRELPFENYPALGPAAWMLVLQWVGADRENIGRVVLVLPYFFWIVTLLELFPRPWPRASFVVVPGLAVLFFDFDRFTHGDQDGFLMMTAGMATIFMVKVLLRLSSAEGTAAQILPALTATADGRRDAFLGAFFAGILGLIKQEGTVLGLILVVSWVAAILAHERPARWGPMVRRLLPSLLTYAAVAALWPTLLLINGVDVRKVQGEAFTVASVTQALGNVDRWPTIQPFFVNYYRAAAPLLVAAAVASVGLAWTCQRTRVVLAFLWGVLILHSGFVLVVFLSTRQQLLWHLRTAFERLAGQGRFVLVMLLGLTLISLATALTSPEGARATDGR